MNAGVQISETKSQGWLRPASLKGKLMVSFMVGSMLSLMVGFKVSLMVGLIIGFMVSLMVRYA